MTGMWLEHDRTRHDFHDISRAHDRDITKTWPGHDGILQGHYWNMARDCNTGTRPRHDSGMRTSWLLKNPCHIMGTWPGHDHSWVNFSTVDPLPFQYLMWEDASNKDGRKFWKIELNAGTHTLISPSEEYDRDLLVFLVFQRCGRWSSSSSFWEQAFLLCANHSAKTPSPTSWRTTMRPTRPDISIQIKSRMATCFRINVLKAKLGPNSSGVSSGGQFWNMGTAHYILTPWAHGQRVKTAWSPWGNKTSM